MLQIWQSTESPAKTLYRYWEMVLKGWAGDLDRWTKMSFGNPSIEIGVPGVDTRGRPILALYYAGVERLWVRKDGSFRIGYLSAGFNSRSRDMLSRHSFLSYNHDFGQYVWHVDLNTFVPKTSGQTHLPRPTKPNGDRWYHYFPLTRDWRQPLPYVPESLIGARTYNTWRKPWLECVPDEEFHWRIELAPARRQQEVDITWWNHWPDEWAHFRELREKRYGAARRAYEIDCGLRPPAKPRSKPTEVTGEMVALFAAAFDLSEPACITPLTRGPKEAQHGYDVAAEGELHSTIVPAHQR